MEYNVSIGIVLSFTFPPWNIADSQSNLLLWLQCVEVAVLLLSFAVFFPCVYAISKHAYLLHVNMRRILFYFGVHYNLYPLVRLTILLYHSGLLKVQGHLPADLPYLIAQVVRGYHLFAGHYALVIFIVERLIATICISHYELTKRLYISTSLISLAVTASLIAPWISGYFTNDDLSSNPILALLLFFSNSFIVSTFIGLVVRNWRLKKRFSQCIQSGYTLPMQYQIRENLRAFKLLRNGMACMIGVAGMQSTASIAFAQRINTDTDFRVLYQQAFDLSTTISLAVMLVVGTVSIAEWRRTFVECLLPKTLCRPKTVSSYDESEPARPPARTPSHAQAALQTEMYFKDLRDSWL